MGYKVRKNEIHCYKHSIYKVGKIKPIQGKDKSNNQ